jgi:hypothetical protein
MTNVSEELTASMIPEDSQLHTHHHNNLKSQLLSNLYYKTKHLYFQPQPM